MPRRPCPPSPLNWNDLRKEHQISSCKGIWSHKIEHFVFSESVFDFFVPRYRYVFVLLNVLELITDVCLFHIIYFCFTLDLGVSGLCLTYRTYLTDFLSVLTDYFQTSLGRIWFRIELPDWSIIRKTSKLLTIISRSKKKTIAFGRVWKWHFNLSYLPYYMFYRTWAILYGPYHMWHIMSHIY